MGANTEKRGGGAPDVEPLPPEREPWPRWWWWVIGAGAVVVLTVWGIALTRDDPSQMGAAGDSVAWVTSLLTLGAVGAALYTNHLQRHELALQRHAIEMQRREQRRSADALEGQLDASMRLAEAMSQQAAAIAAASEAQGRELRQQAAAQRVHVRALLVTFELELRRTTEAVHRPLVSAMLTAGIAEPFPVLQGWIRLGVKDVKSLNTDVAFKRFLKEANRVGLTRTQVDSGISMLLQLHAVHEKAGRLEAELVKLDNTTEREEAPGRREGEPGA